MPSPVSPTRRRRAARGAALAIVLLISVAWGARARAAEPPWGAIERQADPFADRFPDVVLKTHEGDNVRFYEDLLEGKIVLINFMYATCEER